jgi:hypothetical protein
MKTLEQKLLIAHWAWLFYAHGRLAPGLPSKAEQVKQVNALAGEENKLEYNQISEYFMLVVRKLRRDAQAQAEADEQQTEPASEEDLRRAACVVAQAGARRGARSQDAIPQPAKQAAPRRLRGAADAELDEDEGDADALVGPLLRFAHALHLEENEIRAAVHERAVADLLSCDKLADAASEGCDDGVPFLEVDEEAEAAEGPLGAGSDDEDDYGGAYVPSEVDASDSD